MSAPCPWCGVDVEYDNYASYEPCRHRCCTYCYAMNWPPPGGQCPSCTQPVRAGSVVRSGKKRGQKRQFPIEEHRLAEDDSSATTSSSSSSSSNASASSPELTSRKVRFDATRRQMVLSTRGVIPTLTPAQHDWLVGGRGIYMAVGHFQHGTTPRLVEHVCMDVDVHGAESTGDYMAYLGQCLRPFMTEATSQPTAPMDSVRDLPDVAAGDNDPLLRFFLALCGKNENAIAPPRLWNFDIVRTSAKQLSQVYSSVLNMRHAFKIDYVEPLQANLGKLAMACRRHVDTLREQLTFLGYMTDAARQEGDLKVAKEGFNPLTLGRAGQDAARPDKYCLQQMGFDNICFKSFSPDKVTGVLHKQATAVTVSQLDARRLIRSGIFDGKPDLVGSTWEREFRNQPGSLKHFKPQEGDYELLAAVTKATLEGLMESYSAGVIDPSLWHQDIAFDQLKEKVPKIVTIPEAPGRSKHIPDHVLSLTKQRGADKDDDGA